MTAIPRVNVHSSAVTPSPSQDATAPLVDIFEGPDGTVTLVAEVPGVPPEKVDIRVDKGVLTIWADGRQEPPSPSYARTYTSFETGEYFRAFALSDEVDRDKIQAACADGVLTLTLPRAAAARTRKIEVK